MLIIPIIPAISLHLCVVKILPWINPLQHLLLERTPLNFLPFESSTYTGSQKRSFDKHLLRISKIRFGLVLESSTYLDGQYVLKYWRSTLLRQTSWRPLSVVLFSNGVMFDKLTRLKLQDQPLKHWSTPNSNKLHKYLWMILDYLTKFKYSLYVVLPVSILPFAFAPWDTGLMLGSTRNNWENCWMDIRRNR